MYIFGFTGIEFEYINEDKDHIVIICYCWLCNTFRYIIRK